jgi:aromatic ring hydroxylase
MSRCRIGVILLAASVIASCTVFDGPRFCAAIASPGISVMVRDSITDAIVGEGARVIATEGVYADTSQFSLGPEGPHHLAMERAGIYTVTVEQEGYRLWSRSGVRVRRGECGVITVPITARLQR